MIEFKEIEGNPESDILKKIEECYASIFEQINSQKFAKRISEVDYLLINLALHKDKIVGFKIGYQIEPKKFYSWIGGVNKDFRKRGIADELMKRQHNWCKNNGFQIVQTKTKNSFKPMLILNIKNGFDIVEVYTDKQGEVKIILEKTL